MTEKKRVLCACIPKPAEMPGDQAAGQMLEMRSGGDKIQSQLSSYIYVVIKATHYLIVKITNSTSLFRAVLNKVRIK